MGWNGEKMGLANVYISCDYFSTMSFLVKILLVKLKNLYIQYALFSIMKKQHSNQTGKFEKMVVLGQNFWPYLICQFKLKVGILTNSNMKNLIVMFIFLCFRLEVYFFSEICSKNQNFWSWNLESWLIWICRIR